MLKQTSFAYQKQVLERFLSVLTTFEGEFKDLIQKYEENIHALYEEEGLMEEIYEDYNNAYLKPLKSTLLEIVSKISEEDIPFVEKEIDFISSR